MITKKDLINHSKLAELLKVSRSSIRKDKKPEKHRCKIEILYSFVDYWLENHVK